MEDRKFETMTDLRPVRRCFSRVGLACAAFFLITVLVQLAAAVVFEALQVQPDDQTSLLISVLSMYLLAFPVSVLIMRTVPAGIPVRRYSMSVLRFGGLFVICLGIMFLGNLIGQAMMFLVSILTGRPMINQVSEMIYGMDLWETLLVVVVLAPVVEETIFRKLLIDRIAPYSQITAVLLSGGLFGLAHGNFYQFFYAFGLGLVFAYVYLRTARVRYTIALHMMVNFTGGVLPIFLTNLMENHAFLAMMLLGGQMLVLMCSVPCAVILLAVGRRDVWFERRQPAVPTGRWLAAVFGNFGMILFLAYCLSSFIWS